MKKKEKSKFTKNGNRENCEKVETWEKIENVKSGVGLTDRHTPTHAYTRQEITNYAKMIKNQYCSVRVGVRYHVSGPAFSDRCKNEITALPHI